MWSHCSVKQEGQGNSKNKVPEARALRCVQISARRLQWLRLGAGREVGEEIRSGRWGVRAGANPLELCELPAPALRTPGDTAPPQFSAGGDSTL